MASASRPTSEPGSAPDTGREVFEKQDLVWYWHKERGWLEAVVISVDRSLQPPSYQIRLTADDSVRDTERTRMRERARDPSEHYAPAATSSPGAAKPMHMELRLRGEGETGTPGSYQASGAFSSHLDSDDDAEDDLSGALSADTAAALPGVSLPLHSPASGHAEGGSAGGSSWFNPVFAPPESARSERRAWQQPDFGPAPQSARGLGTDWTSAQDSQNAWFRSVTADMQRKQQSAAASNGCSSPRARAAPMIPAVSGTSPRSHPAPEASDTRAAAPQPPASPHPLSPQESGVLNMSVQPLHRGQRAQDPLYGAVGLAAHAHHDGVPRAPGAAATAFAVPQPQSPVAHMGPTGSDGLMPMRAVADSAALSDEFVDAEEGQEAGAEGPERSTWQVHCNGYLAALSMQTHSKFRRQAEAGSVATGVPSPLAAAHGSAGDAAASGTADARPGALAPVGRAQWAACTDGTDDLDSIEVLEIPEGSGSLQTAADGAAPSAVGPRADAASDDESMHSAASTEVISLRMQSEGMDPQLRSSTRSSLQCLEASCGDGAEERVSPAHADAVLPGQLGSPALVGYSAFADGDDGAPPCKPPLPMRPLLRAAATTPGAVGDSAAADKARGVPRLAAPVRRRVSMDLQGMKMDSGGLDYSVDVAALAPKSARVWSAEEGAREAGAGGARIGTPLGLRRPHGVGEGLAGGQAEDCGSIWKDAPQGQGQAEPPPAHGASSAGSVTEQGGLGRVKVERTPSWLVCDAWTPTESEAGNSVADPSTSGTDTPAADARAPGSKCTVQAAEASIHWLSSAQLGAASVDAAGNEVSTGGVSAEHQAHHALQLPMPTPPGPAAAPVPLRYVRFQLMSCCLAILTLADSVASEGIGAGLSPSAIVTEGSRGFWKPIATVARLARALLQAEAEERSRHGFARQRLRSREGSSSLFMSARSLQSAPGCITGPTLAATAPAAADVAVAAESTPAAQATPLVPAANGSDSDGSVVPPTAPKYRSLVLFTSSLGTHRRVRALTERLDLIFTAFRLPVTQVDLAVEPAHVRVAMLDASNGCSGLPQLHVDGVFAGEADVLLDLHDYDELLPMLTAPEGGAEGAVADEPPVDTAESAAVELHAGAAEEGSKAAVMTGPAAGTSAVPPLPPLDVATRQRRRGAVSFPGRAGGTQSDFGEAGGSGMLTPHTSMGSVALAKLTARTGSDAALTHRRSMWRLEDMLEAEGLNAVLLVLGDAEDGGEGEGAGRAERADGSRAAGLADWVGGGGAEQRCCLTGISLEGWKATGVGSSECSAGGADGSAAGGVVAAAAVVRLWQQYVDERLPVVAS